MTDTDTPRREAVARLQAILDHGDVVDGDTPSRLVQFPQADVRTVLAAITRPRSPTKGAGPVAWRVKDFADGWIVYFDQEQAKIAARVMGGATIQALGVIATPPPASDTDLLPEPVAGEWVTDLAAALETLRRKSGDYPPSREERLGIAKAIENAIAAALQAAPSTEGLLRRIAERMYAEYSEDNACDYVVINRLIEAQQAVLQGDLDFAESALAAEGGEL